MELGNIFWRGGYIIVGAAGSGEDAILMSQALKPDLIFMNSKLRGKMDGIDAAIGHSNSTGYPIRFSNGSLGTGEQWRELRIHILEICGVQLLEGK